MKCLQNIFGLRSTWKRSVSGAVCVLSAQRSNCVLFVCFCGIFVKYALQICIYQKLLVILQRKLKMVVMTALQLNAEIYRSLGVLSEDEGMLKRAAKYLKKLADELSHDPTLMSKEEYFRRLDEADKGPKYKMLPNESLDDMLKRLGLTT